MIERRILRWLVTASAGLALVACIPDPFADFIPPDQVQNVRHLSTGLPVPPSASNVWERVHGGQAGLQWLRFDATPAEARRFLRAILRHDPTPGEPRSRPGFNDPLGLGAFQYLESDWWLDSYPTGGVGGAYEDENARMGAVMAPADGRVRVWVYSYDNCELPYACINYKGAYDGHRVPGRN